MTEPRSLDDRIHELRQEYRRFVAGLPPGGEASPAPISYVEWLEAEVIDLRMLRRVMTTAQVEHEFRLAPGSAKKAAQRGSIPAQKHGHDWLILRDDAEREWGWRVREK